MREHLSSFWYHVQSLPYIFWALIIFCAAVFVFLGPYFLLKAHKQEKIAEICQKWIVAPVIFILAIGFSSMLFKFIDYQNKAGVANAADKKELQKLLNLANTENTSLRTEIENLRHASLNVQNFSKITKLSLIETDMVSTIYHTEIFDDEPNVIGKGSHGKQFCLVSHYNIKGLNYGIDLDKIYVSLIDNKLYIFGLQPQYIGPEVKTYASNDVLCEIRKYTSENGQIKIDKVLYDPESILKMEELSKKYHIDDTERINNTTEEFEWINDLVEKEAKDFISTYFKPLEKEIIFEDTVESPDNSIPLKLFYQNTFENVSLWNDLNSEEK